MIMSWSHIAKVYPGVLPHSVYSINIYLGMLQGDNRMDRMLKWVKYLEQYFGHKVHSLLMAKDVPHDPVK